MSPRGCLMELERVVRWCIVTSFFLAICVVDLGQGSLWERWWSYDGINGPSYWGKTNPEWRLCLHGRQQSPINIQPSKLLFDPNLKNIKLETTVTHGLLISTDHDLSIEIKNPRYKWTNISQGPLSYTYRVSQIKFHLANKDNLGSEHRIAGKAFPAEMHIIAYNSDLYHNITEASQKVKGLAIISVFIDIGKEIHKSFYFISKELQWLRHNAMQSSIAARNTVSVITKGIQPPEVKHISIQHLLPQTKEYMTYEGSLSQPACYETVTWIIMNKPILIAKEQLTALRVIYNGRENEVGLPLEINSRPLMPLNNRVIRTNINGTRKYRLCSMEKNMFYQVNTKYIKPLV